MNDSQNQEGELEQVTERMRELDQLKDNFVALVSHELRTPVNLVSGFLELGLDELGEDQTQAQEYLALAYKNTRRIVRVVQELTDFARLQRGKAVTHLDPIPIREALRQTQELLRANMEGKELSLSRSIPPAVLDSEYDGESLIIIFRNILSNAAKFSPPESRIILEGKVKEGSVYLHFRDYADPIPEGKREEIFEDFRQVENYLTRRYEGMGLGLAVARRTARFLGGDILLEVRKDGNTFSVELPD